MKLRSIRISRLPGINEPFTVDGFGDGITVISGPNGIGKSSLCRAMRQLIWPNEPSRQSTTASALFEDEKQGQWLVQTDGQVPRWQLNGVDTDPPPTAAAHLDRCFFLRLPDLIESTQNVGRDVASEIRRQMAGGFELQKILSAFSAKVGKRPGRSERNQFGEVQKKINAASLRQEDLVRQESRLAELAREVQAADAARDRLPHVQSAIGLLGYREELLELESALGLMPPELEHISGSELEEVDSIDSEVEGKALQRRTANKQRDDAIAKVAETGLTQRIPELDLETARKYAEALVSLDQDLKRANEALEGKKRVFETALKACGGRDQTPETLGLPGASKLFAFLRDCNATLMRLGAIDEQLGILDKAIAPAHDPDRSELLERGIHTLRLWLSTPVIPTPEKGGTLGPSRKWILVVTGILVATGAALGFLIHPALFAIAGAGVGLGVAGWVIRVVTDSPIGITDVREVHQREFPSDLQAPESWSFDSVTSRLREFERDLATNLAASRQNDYRDADRTRLTVEREEAVKESLKLDTQRLALVRELDLEEIPPDAELVDLARAVDQMRIAFQDQQGAQAGVTELKRQNTELLGKVSSILAEYDAEVPTDSATAKAAIDTLIKSDQILSKAEDARQTAEDRLDELKADIEKHERRKTEIYILANLPLDDRQALERLIGSIDSYKERTASHSELKLRISTSESYIRLGGAEDLLEMSLPSLEAEQAHLREVAEGGSVKRTQESDIKAEVKNAKTSNALEALLSEREAVRAALLTRRDEVLFGAAGRYLVGQVEAEYESNQMPKVLGRARALFGDFTHHSYELIVAPDDEDSFVAVDTSTRHGHKPDELSDGTRAQLLLASRLAFADEADQGNRLPLFLDEALDQSDPARYEAIVRSLGRLVADDDRQIVYLTNDPTDVARIQNALNKEGCDAAKVIDLAKVRRKAGGVEMPEDLRVDLLPDVPAPGGTAAEQYAVELSVPRFDPSRGHHTQHLIYILWDDLQTLHVLLEGGIDRVGNWLALSSAGAPLAKSVEAGGGAGSQLDARSQLLEAFCDSYAEGRGRTVDAQVIESSAAVSPRYLSEVVDICRELEGDGESLIQALRARADSRLQGFQKKRTEALENYLVENGHIDTRPVLGESDLLTRVHASPAAARLPGEVLGNLVRRWWSLAARRGGT